MEDSFVLLSSMSPKVSGRQKTLNVKKGSKLALKKHFRRSALFDKSVTRRNDKLAIADANTDSSESVSSFSPKNEQNKYVELSDSTNSEDDFCKEQNIISPTLATGKIRQIKKWLKTAKGVEKESDTFFTQVSTIWCDEPTNCDNDNKIAACSSFNENTEKRFDEMFVAKKGLQSLREIEDKPSNGSFTLGLESVSDQPKKLSSNQRSPEKSNVEIIDDSLLTEDMSNLEIQSKEKDSSDGSIPDRNKASSIRPRKKKCGRKCDVLINTNAKNKINDKPRDSSLSSHESDESIENNHLAKENTDPKNESIPTTPLNQDIQEVSSFLDSLYGKKWREKEQSVLKPLTEPKKKPIKIKSHVAVPTSERSIKHPPVKDNLRMNILKPSAKKLNFDNLKNTNQSPWMAKLKGLIDSSDSGSESESEVDEVAEKVKAIEKVKTRLNFDDAYWGFSSKENSSDKENNCSKSVLTKPLKIISSSSSIDDNFTTDDEYDQKVQEMEVRRKSMMPLTKKTYSFLESLSASVPINKCDMSARIFRCSFKDHKKALTEKLFSLFNEKVFEKSIPEDSVCEWNTKLTKTAGRCHCVKRTDRNGVVKRKVRIELSTKVLDSADRLRDTLIHEMCHAATWIVDCVSDGHGKYWKNWAFKAMNAFPELPPIGRCHSYAINSKYTYRCTKCGYSFGRHSKSLDLERKRCGICYGKFEVLLNKMTKSGNAKTVTATPKREPTAFALFVKENYALYKDPSLKHGDVMKVLGQKFTEMKVNK